MDIRTAIIKAQKTFSSDIISEKRIIYILDDYGVFQETPAYRFIIREIIKYSLFSNYLQASEELQKMIIIQFVKKTGFELSLVKNIFDAFCNHHYYHNENESRKDLFKEKVLKFNDGIFAFKHNEKWGWMGINGKIAIEPEYNWVSQFVEGLAIFSTKGIWKDGFYNAITMGCIDFLGNIIIPEEYELIQLSKYKNNVVFVKNNGKYGMLDKNGKTIVTCKYDGIEECGNNIFRTKINSSLSDGNCKYRYGIILLSGKVLCDPIYDGVWGNSFNKNHPYAIVKNNDQFLVLDSEGAYISSFRCSSFRSTIWNNIFKIHTEENKFGLISYEGSIIIDSIFDKIEIDKDVAIAKKDGFWEFYNHNGLKIFTPRLVTAFLHNNNLYGKTEYGQCVEISEDGLVRLLPFEDIHFVFENGKMAVTIKKESFLYNNVLAVYDPITNTYTYLGMGGYTIKAREQNSLDGYIEISVDEEWSRYYFFNTKNGNMFFQYGCNGCGTFGTTSYEILTPIQKIAIIQQKDYSLEGKLRKLQYFIVDYEYNDKVGYYKDTNGELKCRYFDYLSSFKFGLSIFKSNKLYGYMDEKGDIIIPSKFSYAEPFNDKFAIVKENDKYFIIDRNGQNVLRKGFEVIKNIQFPIDYGEV